MAETFTRKELYSMVWSEPVSKVAPRLGLSDRGLGKLCARHRIPVPGRGYWQKRKAGQRVRKKRLPRLYVGEDALATIRLSPPPKEPKKVEGVVEERREFERDNPVVVKERVGRYHPLVRETRKALQGKSTGGLDVHVSSGLRRRALLIMDALVKAIEERGWSVEVSDGATIVRLRGVTLGIELKEKTRQVVDDSRRYRRYRTERTGQLALRITSGSIRGLRKTWGDGKRQRVEKCLNKFIVGLVAAAERKKVVLREREEQRRRWEEEARIRRERRRREREEEMRVEELVRQADSWASYRRVCEYVPVLRAAAEDGSAELKAWLEWAESYVERADPRKKLEGFSMPTADSYSRRRY